MKFNKGKITLNGEYTIEQICDIVRENHAEYFKRGFTASHAGRVKQYCLDSYAQEEREHFNVIWLDNKHRVIKQERLFSGTIDSSQVAPREVVKAALNANAAAVILCHNHPSGVTTPSRSDIEITGKIKKALEVVDVRVLDHIIVGKDATSMSSQGFI